MTTLVILKTENWIPWSIFQAALCVLTVSCIFYILSTKHTLSKCSQCCNEK